MRLKTLELQGFKSFPDKTKLSIDHGMTVVVGPNGSGKSNISDAIRFVLGEGSSKNIRGKKMEDIIFSGTEQRRPMGFAQVSLTLDNTAGDIPLPLEYDEVTVTRKVFRSGNSEYYINGKPVRQKDIHELFMNTGLGKSGYSIIGQGRVDEIISEKSEDRRGIFEEAAGITKYRYQKSSAEKKLAETEDNLSRVSDILGELEGRVGPLEKDAAKARKYLELYEEKKKADVSLWLYEIDGILEQSEKLREDYAIAKHSLEMAEDSIRGLEAKSEKLRETLRESRAREEEARRLLTLNKEKMHELESSEKLYLRDIEHLLSEKERLAKERLAKTEDGKKAAEALEECILRGKEAAEKEEGIRTALRDAEGRLDARRGDVQKSSEEEDAIRAESDRLQSQIVSKQMEISNLEGTDDSDDERRRELGESTAALNERIADAGQKLLKSEKTLAEYRAKIDGIRKEEEELLAAEKRFAEKSAAIKAEMEQEQSNRSGSRSRMEALQRMEEHFEGYAGSVRFVMDKAERGVLRGVYGPVSRLLQLEGKYAVAIETALGGNLQNIIVEDEAAAKAAIRCLAENKAGRTTFYPVRVMRPERLSVDHRKLSGMPGYIGLANELVHFEEAYRPVMDYLLCRTVVCKDLDSAGEIARAFGYKFRIVTLDGQIINAGGSFTGGSAKRDSGMLTRRSEIDRLRSAVEASEKRSDTLRQQLQGIEKEETALRQQREQLGGTLEILQVMMTAEDTDQKVKSAQLQSDREQLSKIGEALASLDEKSESRSLSMEEAKKALQVLSDALQEKKALLLEKQKSSEALQAALETLIDEKNALLLKQTVAVRDCELAMRDVESAKEAIAAAKAAEDALSESLAKTEQKEASVRASMESTKEELAALEEMIRSGQSEEDSLKSDTEESEKLLETLQEQEKQKRHDRDVFLQSFSKLEAKLGSIETEQDKYTSRLWDEYELTYTAAAELNYPKLTKESRIPMAAAQTKLRGQIKALGNVNVGAIEEYTEVKQRFDFLSGQYKDLTSARADLTGIIYRLENEMRVRFMDTFRSVNDNFKTVFSDLFGGGKADLSLTDPENPLESGIEITAAPPGKIVKNLTQLSGGEQAFIAIALFFAILKVTPAPFCLLDEIESALDEVNVSRLATYSKHFSDKTQFIFISHRRGTMEEADALYGVTMQERGISRVLSLDVSEVEAKLGAKLS